MTRARRCQTKRMMKAMTSAYSATASVSAKPRIARPNTRSRDAGLRATLVTSEPKIVPMPMPTPARAIMAIPAPIILAEATSIVLIPFVSSPYGRNRRPVVHRVKGNPSVQMNRVVQVDAGQHREDVSLQGRHQQLEPDQDRV